MAGDHRWQLDWDRQRNHAHDRRLVSGNRGSHLWRLALEYDAVDGIWRRNLYDWCIVFVVPVWLRFSRNSVRQPPGFDLANPRHIGCLEHDARVQFQFLYCRIAVGFFSCFGDAISLPGRAATVAGGLVQQVTVCDRGRRCISKFQSPMANVAILVFVSHGIGGCCTVWRNVDRRSDVYPIVRDVPGWSGDFDVGNDRIRDGDRVAL